MGIDKTVDGEELFKLAVAKHSKRNANEITDSFPLAHKLLYLDRIEVIEVRNPTKHSAYKNTKLNWVNRTTG